MLLQDFHCLLPSIQCSHKFTTRSFQSFRVLSTTSSRASVSCSDSRNPVGEWGGLGDCKMGLV